MDSNEGADRSGASTGLKKFASRPITLFVAWIACAGLLYGMVIASHYPLRDPDSTLYESIATSLKDAPISTWIAPRWPQGRSKTGPFLEHTAVLFWPAAALDRMGFERGSLLANLVYFLLSLYFLFRLARSLASESAAWMAVFAYTFSLLGIQYELRANHETAWGAAFLAGFWCLTELRRSRWFGVGFIACAVFAVAIKGLLAFVFFPVMAVWWWTVSKRSSDVVWFVGAVAAVVVGVVLYDNAYRAATGNDFLTTYYGIQTGYVTGAERHRWLLKLVIPIYYLGDVAWFTLPSSALLLVAACRRKWRDQMKGPPLDLFLRGGGTQVALLSLSNHAAVRYIFPVYPLGHIAGAAFLDRIAPRLRGWIERHIHAMPYILMGLMLVFHPIRIWFDLHFYRFINIKPNL